MQPLIYLIGTSDSWVNQIMGHIDDTCLVKHVTKSMLMQEIYHQKPHCLVIIADDTDSDGYALIDSTISLEYIPTVCIAFEPATQNHVQAIDHATFIEGHQLSTLMPLITQAYRFSIKYHDLHTSQDTYDIMNEEVKTSLEDYLIEDSIYDHKVLMKYLKLVYVNNIFLDNHPQALWMIKQTGQHKFSAKLYAVGKDNSYIEKTFTDEVFSFEPFKDTGFFKNSSIDELSDVGTIQELVPPALLDMSGQINNVASFAIHDMMTIAMNFNQGIGQSDLNILKALTIKLDLMSTIKDKVTALEASFDYTMNALARAAEGKDDTTGFHIKRVNHYSKFIARQLGLTNKFVKSIYVSAQMHDVGKIYTPESILNKPGKLTDEEFSHMQAHTVQGQSIIGESDDLKMAANIARYHHEKYDGTGYPDKLKGDQIPLEARIVFLADIYDALRSPRPYKPGFSHEKAYDIITQGDGRVEPSHFDPEILKVFKDKHQQFDKIFEQYKDE